MQIDCFKAYDVRGRIPDQLNEDIALRIANATVEYLGAKKVVVGRDIRLSSPAFADAVCVGIVAAGAEAVDIGLGGTEMMYFATDYLGADAGIMVTASHNPADYNGLKIVREGARPISAESGLDVIRRLAESDERQLSEHGKRSTANIMAPYIEKLLGFVDVNSLKPLKIAVNPGNGGAGIVLDNLKY
ncbi:MAG: phosphomannomutase, partial [Gammaproteobacteria bacterium]|nr:phosphomannomutase [Gammaproteobacteria bacterium]